MICLSRGTMMFLRRPWLLYTHVFTLDTIGSSQGSNYKEAQHMPNVVENGCPYDVKKRGGQLSSHSTESLSVEHTWCCVKRVLVPAMHVIINLYRFIEETHFVAG